ncbi:hypothetical protein [Photobacterium lutimaris]|uniref:Uncharacterized protein n=1 Tax=Photobacterium lutimaris TaxID=388278 RepID=A0A2T3J4H8_9GAMM|nr:hypothetical protein [Photobacterium lutimaris]PSU36195.1 hypothetical protein C9I99_04130 [Photobacterium lutimaris]TDR74934.1 hypothetical protein DFP78_106265 [Photobacterium lutimaris]
MAAEIGVLSRLGGWLLSKLRQKEHNLKAYYAPYYEEAEKLVVEHVQVINWLGDECHTYTGFTEEQIEESFRETQAHNEWVHKNAAQIANGKSLEQMRVDVINLVARIDDAVDPALIDSLKDYSRNLAEADELGEYHFLVDQSKNLLKLVRDLKGKIPTVHSKSAIQ